jgi:hypothetical protein
VAKAERRRRRVARVQKPRKVTAEAQASIEEELAAAMVEKMVEEDQKKAEAEEQQQLQQQQQTGPGYAMIALQEQLMLLKVRQLTADR